MGSVPASIALNGPFAAALDGRAVSFAHRGAGRLLAYLALHGPAERERAAHALWPAVDRERALMSLRQALRAVVVAGGEGWVVAGRSNLRLDPRVEVRRGEGPLLDGWDEPWIDAHRPRPAASPPTEALFELLAWYGERDPEAALRLASEARATLDGVAPARLVREISPVMRRVARLPEGTEGLANAVARAHYLQGRMEEAYALFERIIREPDPRRGAEWIASAHLSQIVLLRESGAAGEAARRAASLMASRPDTPFFGWSVPYHLGLSRHLAGEADGLRTAHDAVVSSAVGSDALTRLFPVLNVAEGLIDANDPAARALLEEARRLAPLTGGDALGRLSVEMLEALLLAPEEGLERLRGLERRAWEARLAPFAAGLAERAALLAHHLGRLEDARRLLARGDRVRKRLGLRRVPLERRRLAPLRAVAPRS